MDAGQGAKYKKEALHANDEARDWYNRWGAVCAERDDVQAKLEEAAKENARLKAQLEDVVKESKSFAEQFSNLEKLSTEKDMTIQKLKAEVDAEKSKLKRIESDVVSLHSELRDEQQAREQLGTQKDELEAQNMALLDDNKELAEAHSAASKQAIAGLETQAQLQQVLDTFRAAYDEQSEAVTMDMYLERFRDSQPQLRLPRNQSHSSINNNRDSLDLSNEHNISNPSARDRQVSLNDELNDELNGQQASGYESEASDLSDDHDPELFGTGKEDPSDIYSELGDDTMTPPKDRSRYTNQIFQGHAQNYSSKNASGRTMSTQTPLTAANGEVVQEDKWTPDPTGPNPNPPESIGSEEVGQLKNQKQQLETQLQGLGTTIEQLRNARDAEAARSQELLTKLTARSADWQREKNKAEERLKTVSNKDGDLKRLKEAKDNEVKAIKEFKDREYSRLMDSKNNEVRAVKESKDREYSRLMDSKNNEVRAVKESKDRDIKRLKETNEDLSRTLTQVQSQSAPQQQPQQKLGLSSINSISTAPMTNSSIVESGSPQPPPPQQQNLALSPISMAPSSISKRQQQQTLGFSSIKSVSTAPSAPQATLLQSNRRRDPNLAPVKWQLALWGVLLAILTYLFSQVLWEREMWRSRNEITEQQDARVLHFDFDALLDAAIKCSPGARRVTHCDKKEGGFDRVFMIHMDNASTVVARLPTRVSGPPRLTVCSEVATLQFVRENTTVPVPTGLSWKAGLDDGVGTEYMILEAMPGVPLKDVWHKMTASQHVACIRSIGGLCKQLCQLSFSAYGSLYFYTEAPAGAVRLDDKFCIGPLCAPQHWGCSIDSPKHARSPHARQGPWHKINDYFADLIGCAKGSGPATSSRRHLELLDELQQSLNVLLESQVTTAANGAILYHPDLNSRNIFVDPADHAKVTGIVDWQSAAIEPAFVFAASTPDFADELPDQEASAIVTEEVEAHNAKVRADVELCTQAWAVMQQICVKLRPAS
ncbi:hypothetical protein EJ03DRAFT_352297 [Teratosphaeria nubilosa]|uniref:Altered inheritance of mitochondria protein 9, mitochondrial n=1 Tax=Teratosphaeria nubilosa TaxID=161662 RepID=A0A6G1L694_9PEZI|nr:hypothetical protein EJ03DRAFT_352297 [Teratosphaeria nubilosa]